MIQIMDMPKTSSQIVAWIQATLGTEIFTTVEQQHTVTAHFVSSANVEFGGATDRKITHGFSDKTADASVRDLFKVITNLPKGVYLRTPKGNLDVKTLRGGLFSPSRVVVAPAGQ